MNVEGFSPSRDDPPLFAAPPTSRHIRPRGRGALPGAGGCALLLRAPPADALGTGGRCCDRRRCACLGASTSTLGVGSLPARHPVVLLGRALLRQLLFACRSKAGDWLTPDDSAIRLSQQDSVFLVGLGNPGCLCLPVLSTGTPFVAPLPATPTLSLGGLGCFEEWLLPFVPAPSAPGPIGVASALMGQADHECAC
eukprot:353188-Chlamydomonas_euryale.AAC.5